LGGARADFVANLGKRRVELRITLDALRGDPSSKRHRDELRRRVHALGAGAKLLRFPRLSEELKLVEHRLEDASHRGKLEDDDFGAVQDLIGRMTSLAWGQADDGDSIVKLSAAKDSIENLRASSADQEEAAPRAPVSVLVVGGSSLADALTMPGSRASEDDGQAFEVERTHEAPVALDLARALAPDVAVIDGELPDAKKLVTDLLSDPLTDAIPLIVTLRIARADDAGPFLALGVARVLPKPVSPSELRRACAAVVATYVRREVQREPLGDLTLDQLGARLAEELRRGLGDTVDPDARSSTLKLGEGTEMLAALWGAVARIRDVVTIKTQGQVRFANGGPEGAVPLAPWLESTEAATSAPKRSNGRVSRADTETSLEKTKILVADDDAAVCWFLAGVLKTAGATVYEARDGERALEVAKHVNPDLVVTDILMPRMDGFSLSRILRRDIVLRDVPIVLLSWKEDLLQRVRELGADADGYLRKEASAGAIVQRVRELVRQRKRVAQRIATQGEVRGRLDGLTTHSLLRLVCQLRESSTVSVRDASFLYEVEVRRGKPARATRTALSGAFERGPTVLAALLGVGDGRFSVSPPREDQEVAPVRFDLSGSLAEQVMPIVATARAAQRLLSGGNLMRVKRVEIDDEAFQAYASPTPELARGLVQQVSAGVCPRDLVTSGIASARLLEDVLIDAAVHGAVFQVLDAEGEDRLPEATAQELALLRGDKSVAPIATLPVLAVPMGTPAPMTSIDVAMPKAADLVKLALAKPAPALGPAPEPMPARPAAPVVDAAGNIAPLSAATGQPSRMPTPPPPATDAFDQDEEAGDAIGGSEIQPSGLAEPREREESPIPPSGPRAITPPPRTMVMSEPAKVEPAPRTVKEKSGPSDRELAARELTPTPSSLPPPPGLKPMLTLGSLHPPPVTEPVAAPAPTPKPKNVKKSPSPPPVAVKEKEKEPAARDKNELTPRFPLPSAFFSPPAPKKKDHKALYWVGFALVGVVFAVWARWSHDRSTPSESDMMASMGKASAQAESAPRDPAASQDTAAESQEPIDDAAPKPEQKADATAKPKLEESPIEELPLRDGDKVKKGSGMLEVVAGKSDTILIDGKAIGSGPVVTLPLKARKDAYEVKVKTRGEERSRFVTVKEGKMVRLRLAPPWQR